MSPCFLHLVPCAFLLVLLGGCADEEGTWTGGPTAPEKTALDPAVREVIEKRVAAVKRDPDSASAQRSLGLAYEANSAWGEAVSAFRAAVDLEPTDHAARLHLAICLIEAGGDAEHIEQLERVVKEQPDGPAARFRLGQAYLNVGRFVKAQEQFSALRGLLPGRVHAHTGLGQVLLQQDDAEGALPHLRKAQSLDSDDLFVAFVLGQCLADLGHTREAMPLLSRGADADPPQLPDTLTKELDTYGVGLTARLARVNRLVEGGNLIRAITILKDLKTQYPEDLTVLNNLGAIYIQANQDEEALATLNNLLAIEPTHAQAWLNTASIHYERGRALLTSDRAAAQPHLVKALRAADKAVSFAGHSTKMHTQRGITLLALGSHDEAIAEFQEAIRMGTSEETVYLDCARLLFRQGREGSCLQTLLAGSQSHPEWVEVRIQIIPYYVRRRDSLGARSLLEEIRALAPEDPRLTDIQNLISENGL